MKVFVVDHAKCNGCYNCQIACKDEHVGNDWSPIAKPQPQIGHFWIGVNETTRGTVPRVRVTYEPTLCQHCDDAGCVKAAPDAVYKRDDGLVIVDPEKAAGRPEIVESCPYGAIYWNDELKVAQKCTGCAHLLDQGWKEPRCVEVCPTEALLFGEEEDLRDKIAGATVLHPELKTSPRVYHSGIPGKFVAGGVYDPVADEIIEGATLRLADASGDERVAETDGFGDFWFEDLETGEYTLFVEADGFRTETIAAIRTEDDVNLGDIAMQAGEVRA
jgi:Fe-S-cluster-containing dehydrogenase component